MSMLARYKKSGSLGITELVKLIEGSPEPKRTNLLNMVRSEDPIFAVEIEARLYDFDKFRTLPESIVAEVLSSTSPKFMALALYGDTSDFVKLCEKCLGKNFAEYKSEVEVLKDKPPTPSQIDTAQRKIVSEARKAEGDGRLRLPMIGASAMQLAEIQSRSAAAPNAAAGVPGALGDPVATGKPTLGQFNMEEPPERLTGFQFSSYLKTQLGK
jgi:flagellar motor switch protein FliG